METSVMANSSVWHGLGVTQVRILRLGIGTALGFIIAISINWQLAFLTPLLLSKLLLSPNKPLGFKTGIGLLLIILLAFFPFLLLGQLAIIQPAVAVGLLLLAFFYIFYFNALKKLNPIVTIMLLLGIILMPLLSRAEPQLSWLFFSGFLFSTAIAVFFAWVCFWLLPDPVGTSYPPKPELESPVEKQLAQIQAFVSTLVVFPLALFFYATSALNEVLVIAFVAILMQSTDLAGNIKTGMVLVLTNILGGLVAMGIYLLLSAVPSLAFFTLIMMAVCLLVARQIYSGSKWAPFFAAGFSTTLVLVSSITGATGGDFNEEFLSRILQISLASCYVVAAIVIIQSLLANEKLCKKNINCLNQRV